MPRSDTLIVILDTYLNKNGFADGLEKLDDFRRRSDESITEYNSIIINKDDIHQKY